MQKVHVATWRAQQLRGVVARKQRRLRALTQQLQSAKDKEERERAVLLREEAVVDVEMAQADADDVAAQLRALRRQVRHPCCFSLSSLLRT